MEKEFLAVYEKHADAVFCFCFLRVFEREKAKDLMQQTFLKTWEYLSGGKRVDNVKAFVFRVARNLIIDQVRTKKEQVSVEGMLEEGVEIKAKSEDWDLKIDLQKVRKLLDELEEIYREPLTLRYVEGFGPKEIAQILGESENVVSVRIHRGLKLLKLLLKRSDF
jgi:RNA polymerase sigma-70 factor (ECF subfamily)